MKKITLVIIDDHKLIRNMWARMFAANPGIEVTGESANLHDTMELIKIKKPDIVLLDINLGLESGMDAVPLIRKFSPGSKIIAVSMHTQPSYAKKMLQVGAKAYVTKNSSWEEMLKAIEEVMKGNIYMCSEIKEISAEQVRNTDSDTAHIKNLTIRELEIIKLIKNGNSSKEISAKLNLGTRTIEVHRFNILKKMKLNNTASLVNFINNTDLNFD